MSYVGDQACPPYAVNHKIRYNDNLNVTKHSLKSLQLMKNYARICIKTSNNICFEDLLESLY